MPLSKDELWRLYAAANPHWLNDGARLTPAGLKRLIEQTYDVGRAKGVEDGKAMAGERGIVDEVVDGVMRLMGRGK